MITTHTGVPHSVPCSPPTATTVPRRPGRPGRRRGTSRAVVTSIVVTLAVSSSLVACGSNEDNDSAETQETVNLAATPDNVTWSTLHAQGSSSSSSAGSAAGGSGGDVSVKVPSADQGPEQVGTYGEASGFDFSPVGAGLAALNAPLRVAFAPEDHWDAAVAAGIAPGQGRDELLTNRAALSSTGGVDADLVPTLAGWVVTDYLDEDGSPASSNEQGRSASVEVYARYPDESISKTTYQVVRSGGDWKVQLPGEVEAVDELADNLVEVSPDA